MKTITRVEQTRVASPAPWKDSGHDGKRNILVESIDGTVCAVWDTGCTNTQRANALLIAAAPDLLDALNSLLYCGNCDPRHEARFEAMFEKARRAIAKAVIA